MRQQNGYSLPILPDLKEGVRMENRTGEISFDAEWYCRKDPEEERFYEIFFQMCQKYGVRWASAEGKERQFIEEVTRVTYERERALRLDFRCQMSVHPLPPKC